MAYLKVDDRGRQIYYEHYQGKKTPVLLAHGWGMSCRVWDNVVAVLLEAGHEVVIFDQRACGRSDKDFNDVSISASVGDIVALVETLGLKKVVLNGWSLGGALVVGAAEALGQQCKGLVLTCAATPRYEQCEDFPHGLPVGSVAGTGEALNADRFGFLHQLAQGVFPEDPGGGTIDWLSAMFKGSGPGANKTIAELADLDQRAMMKSLSMPILNVVGGKDAVADPEVGRYAHSIQSKGTLIEFDACGHAPFLEEPARYNEELLNFITNSL